MVLLIHIFDLQILFVYCLPVSRIFEHFGAQLMNNLKYTNGQPRKLWQRPIKKNYLPIFDELLDWSEVKSQIGQRS